MADREVGESIINELLAKLAEGQSLNTICQDPHMPNRTTVWRWSNGDDELAQRLLEAREIGFFARAERAVEDAKAAKDPIAGRLAFDAERWYLGKLSNAFRDKPVAIGAFVGVGGDDAFAAVAGALDRAAASLASSGHSTQPVVIEGKARPGDTTGRLADLAGPGGERLGEDQDGG
ncbi:hypothetical protein [Altericroceibacterium xinjiangense]|uniref:terminase small subunit-like protein n=1 Tax=Altericroceibacterium xinjiangense TaxID=762261 RepID=UPI0019CFE080|nr:hypothetical protein [Altericroceibacterium xinjiangense]